MSEPQDQTEAACGGSALTAELGTDFANSEERYLREMIATLNAHHEKMIKPYIDRLVDIHSLRPRPAMMVTREQAEALGLMVPNGEVKAAPLRGVEP